MRTSALASVLLSLLSALACARVDRSREAAPASAREEPAPAALGPEHEQLFARLSDAKARLEQELSPPSDRERSRCPDELIAAAPPPGHTLMLRTVDARMEAKTPLPLRLVTSLSSDEFSAVVKHLSGGAAALWDPTSATPHTRDDAAFALAALDQLAARRYLAELRIETYSEPNLFRRKDAPRSEWNPGIIAGRLVVYDLSERRALCQAPVLVRGNAEGLPIRRRLREQTRAKLRDALNERTYAALEGAIASITSRFVLPPATERGSGAERWAAAPEHVASTARFERRR